MRLLQFLASHFNATRLGSPHTEKVFIRLLNATLDSLKHATGHPLAREIRFQIILFALKVLKHSIGLDFGARCLLKNRILSSALSWFSFPPRWSFGGNRLQLKAETRLLADVAAAFRSVQMVAEQPAALIKSIKAKETLLLALIESELSRLAVWLYPLGEPGAGVQGARTPTEVSGSLSYTLTLSNVEQATLVGLVRTAWLESPSLAIQLALRFPQSARLRKEIRWLLLNFPDKAISEPEAVEVLLGETMPSDVRFQLKASFIEKVC